MSGTHERRALLIGAAALALARRGMAQGAAPAKAPLRIGVLNDQSGPYADLAGPGSVSAVRLAVADAAAAGLDRPVEVYLLTPSTFSREIDD